MSRTGVGRVVAMVAIALSAVALLLLLGAGPGTRLGLWHFRTGLSFLAYVVFAGAAGAVIGLVGLVLGGARAVAAAAVVIGLAAVSVPIAMRSRAQALPMIHDITTDTENPPAFEAVLAARGAGSNPAEYPGAEVAAQQKTGYPDLGPVVLPASPPEAFERALAAARDQGWDIAATDSARGRIEATDTTFWFGFKDDIVVRIRPEGTGSRIDVRSKSRVGRSDVGMNARRIRSYLAALQRPS